jgi:stage II sporulation protein D
LILNLVDVESYTAGVINHEIDARWPEAAVDAQAIMIRTYALKRREERAKQPYDLDRTVSDQVYGGVAAEDEPSWAAVKRTRGLVLTYQGGLVSAFYHACCGGRTETPSAVWGGHDEPYQQSVACKYCQNAPRYFWRVPLAGAISGRDLAALLGLSGEVREVQVPERTPSGRAAKVEVLTELRRMIVSGAEFREWMGLERLFSAAFQVDREDDGFVFMGSGAGHGVGLCQWGAKGMAAAGFNSKSILYYYFPGTKVANVGKGK